MNEVNEASPANTVSDVERVTMCTTSTDSYEHSRIRKAMEDAGMDVRVVESCRTTLVIKALDLDQLPMVLLRDDRNSQFGRRRKKGGFRRYT